MKRGSDGEEDYQHAPATDFDSSEESEDAPEPTEHERGGRDRPSTDGPAAGAESEGERDDGPPARDGRDRASGVAVSIPPPRRFAGGVVAVHLLVGVAVAVVGGVVGLAEVSVLRSPYSTADVVSTGGVLLALEGLSWALAVAVGTVAAVGYGRSRAVRAAAAGAGPGTAVMLPAPLVGVTLATSRFPVDLFGIAIGTLALGVLAAAIAGGTALLVTVSLAGDGDTRGVDGGPNGRAGSRERS